MFERKKPAAKATAVKKTKSGQKYVDRKLVKPLKVAKKKKK